MISFLSTIAATPIATPTYTTSSDSQPTQSPITPTEGQGVKCSIGGNGDARELYRYTGGKLSWYPNPEIAASWDKILGNLHFGRLHSISCKYTDDCSSTRGPSS